MGGVGSYPLLSQVPTLVKVEWGCDNTEVSLPVLLTSAVVGLNPIQARGGGWVRGGGEPQLFSSYFFQLE